MTTDSASLGRVADIPENGSKGFTLEQDQKIFSIFIIKYKSQLFAYKNQCPHTGANLNWQPDVFMDYEQRYIQCAIHGAKFEVKTGLCIWGPCASQSLTKVDIIIEDEKIFLR